MNNKADVAMDEIRKIKNELVRQMNQLESKLMDKANQVDLDKLDDHFSKSLDQVVASTNKKFVEKRELRSLLSGLDN